MENRYTRQVQLPGFGAEAQEKLQRAKVLVVGAGGLGVPVLQYLTGMGVGTIGVVDGDTVSLTNLHRQILFSDAHVGSLKVQVAVTRLQGQNPEVAFTAYPTFLTVENAVELVQEYDLVIDATDSFEARYLINDVCVLLHKPFVYGALHQFEGQVSVFNYLGGPTYRCLYPAPPSAQEIPDCNTAGVLGVVPGLIGCHQALEAVKVITGIAAPLSGYLLMFDFLNQSQYKVKLKAKQENQTVRQLLPSYSLAGCATVRQLSVEELHQWVTQGKDVLLLDVRETEEHQQGHLARAQLLPLSRLSAALDSLPRRGILLTICQKGSRSQKAAELISQACPALEVYSIAGGMDHWRQQFGNLKLVQWQA
ncbi:HesA/MoeB/ThiF family protein [Rufibacter ruber]|uniref:HesA/MoeB/ThiF family protein n=1 Tax=Rufibacter ruber TaxID=1783499 RepID=UPI000830CE07|nr:HesA/MoeB/ThiF family protein [Rufibacter ruber]